MAREEDVWRQAAKLKLEKMPPEAKEIRETAMRDLFFFARLVNPGYVYGDIHKKIFKWLENYSLYGQGQEQSTNKLILLPRGHLKSHMVATWAAWVITKHPEVTILYLSATAELAEKQLFSIQNIMAGNSYQRYFPEYINPQEGKREKWSQRKFSIDHEKRREEGIRDETVSTAGLTTNTTGWHADIIIPDDLVVPENAYTEDGRNKVLDKSSQFTSIRNAGGFTLACGTRYHPRDVYASWKDQEYEIYDDEGELLEKRSVWEIQEFAVELDGIFIWPKAMRDDKKFFGFDKQVLARIQAEYQDKTQFYAQYYNNPNDPGSNRIDTSKFQYFDRKFLKQTSGHWYIKNNRLNVYAAIDFAFSFNKRSDDTAIVVIGIDANNFIYVLDIDVFKSDKIADYFNHIVQLHSRWEFKKMRAEVSVAQAVIVRDLKDKMRDEGLSLTIEEHRPTRNEGTKAERIASALEHRYDNMEMWHCKGGYTDMLEEQLVLARPPHDDIKDALASAVEITIRPRRTNREDLQASNNIVYHPRFGGIAFGGSR